MKYSQIQPQKHESVKNEEGKRLSLVLSLISLA
jgi:hypothetical protein